MGFKFIQNTFLLLKCSIYFIYFFNLKMFIFLNCLCTSIYNLRILDLLRQIIDSGREFKFLIGYKKEVLIDSS